jgi:glutamine amidotransferase
VAPYLETFARISKNSKEYQGHGWGCAYKDVGGAWKLYRDIRPIWEDDLGQFPQTLLLVAHARSAFDDRDIVVENNMPFFDGQTVFVFNGELRGVKIREKGRIGAEKIFNFIRRFDRGDTEAAMRRAIGILKKRTRYIRAMNIIMVNDRRIHVASTFSEQESYFTMHHREGPPFIVCSESFPGETGWESIPNHSVRTW